MKTEEDYAVVDSMEKFGGSFVKALAGAMRCADMQNFKILRKAFPEYWKQYKKIS